MKPMEDRLFFPLFVDLSEKTVLVVGGGKIASRRTETLLPFAGHITVTAPETTQTIADLAEAGRIELRRRAFADTDIEEADIVLCATGDEAADRHVFTLCRERGVLVNLASDREKCDFYFPGIARRGSVVVGVTAGGTDHRAARETTEAIRRLLSEE
ncbi:MAG: bifunctional precorrin-2 dehydrogenase/sirohydrochlorin ferrochelatase [Oscillospiraceae bacterium]|nr:bifunctional precorrin-2 dehydrogenase/sirohydrochlorin ferrochelatase [Oscillospiraceae bacterium]